MVTCLISRKPIDKQDAVCLRANGKSLAYVSVEVWQDVFEEKEHTRLTFDMPEDYQAEENAGE